MSSLPSKIENYSNLILFLDAIPLPGVIIGTDEFVHYANKKARDLFGDLIQDRHYITVMRDPEVSDAIEAVIKILIQEKLDGQQVCQVLIWFLKYT